MGGGRWAAGDERWAVGYRGASAPEARADLLVVCGVRAGGLGGDLCDRLESLMKVQLSALPLLICGQEALLADASPIVPEVVHLSGQLLQQSVDAGGTLVQLARGRLELLGSDTKLVLARPSSLSVLLRGCVGRIAEDLAQNLAPFFARGPLCRRPYARVPHVRTRRHTHPPVAVGEAPRGRPCVWRRPRRSPELERAPDERTSRHHRGEAP